MKPSTERKIIRWVHIIFSIPVIGYLYGPVAAIPRAAFAARWVFFPIIVLSGIWLWKGQWVKKTIASKHKNRLS
jgi:hypothetical protein